MRILAALYLFFLVQGDVGTFAGQEQPVPGLARRKRSWSWSSGSSKKVTERPIGWNVNPRPVQQYVPQQQQQQQYVPQQRYVPQQQYYYTPPTQNRYSKFTVSFSKPTKSRTNQLVKAAVAVGVAGAVSAYAKPVRTSTKSPQQREEERERRRQQRLSRRSTTTAIPPVEANGTTTTTEPVPLAQSELIPVMVQDANQLLQIVYVRKDQIPPGGIPIAMQLPFPPAQQQQQQQQPGQQEQPQQPQQPEQPSPVIQPQLQAPSVNSSTEPPVTVLPIPTAQP
uniref:Uncharacterized protein n=1 Tax=Anopheles stephensi TaxID=30069 RepID=A0A182YA02_ANOST